MKKILALFLACICLCLVSCGKTKYEKQMLTEDNYTQYLAVNASFTDYYVKETTSELFPKKYFATVTIEIKKAADVKFEGAYLVFGSSGYSANLDNDGNATFSYTVSSTKDFASNPYESLNNFKQLKSWGGVGGYVLIPK